MLETRPPLKLHLFTEIPLSNNLSLPRHYQVHRSAAKHRRPHPSLTVRSYQAGQTRKRKGMKVMRYIEIDGTPR